MPGEAISIELIRNYGIFLKETMEDVIIEPLEEFLKGYQGKFLKEYFEVLLKIPGRFL